MEVIISLIRWSRFYPEGNGRVIIDERHDRVLADMWRMGGIDCGEDAEMSVIIL